MSHVELNILTVNTSLEPRVAAGDGRRAAQPQPGRHDGSWAPDGRLRRPRLPTHARVRGRQVWALKYVFLHTYELHVWFDIFKPKQNNLNQNICFH